MWNYRILTGDLEHDGRLIGRGYSGFPPHTNDPTATALKNLGPIPVGAWTMGRAFHHPLLGEIAIPLTPDSGTDTHGRTDFYLHGDSAQHPGRASHGCIAIGHDVRQSADQSDDRALTVIEK